MVLSVAFAALVCDGMELGLMPVAAGSITRDLLGPDAGAAAAGDWFAWYTAAVLLGAAVGGIVLGALGDRIGRTRALAISVLFYSVFAGLGSLVSNVEQMLVLRFLVGLGVGGVWPNGVALVSECWPNVARPMVAGIVGAGLNAGILLLSQLATVWHVTPDSWRWLFAWCGAPALLGIVTLFWVPESPRWLASRAQSSVSATPLRNLCQPPLLRLMLLGIALGAVPMIGAWASSKWLIPWADLVGGSEHPGLKAATQGWWAFGAVLGSFCGAHLAHVLGRRRSYALISIGATALTCGVFLASHPLSASFLPLVFAQGFVATLFFGWLPLFLPEMFPTAVRATGSGIAYNTGRFATAGGMFAAGVLLGWCNGDIARLGAITGGIYFIGLVVIWFLPRQEPGRLQD